MEQSEADRDNSSSIDRELMATIGTVMCELAKVCTYVRYGHEEGFLGKTLHIFRPTLLSSSKTKDFTFKITEEELRSVSSDPRLLVDYMLERLRKEYV